MGVSVVGHGDVDEALPAGDPQGGLGGGVDGGPVDGGRPEVMGGSLRLAVDDGPPSSDRR